MIGLYVTSEVAKDFQIGTDVHLCISNLKSPLTSVRSQECPLRLLGGSSWKTLETVYFIGSWRLPTCSEYSLGLSSKILVSKTPLTPAKNPKNPLRLLGGCCGDT